MSVQKKFGGELSEEEFRKFTLYTTQSGNFEDDTVEQQFLVLLMKESGLHQVLSYVSVITK